MLFYSVFLKKLDLDLPLESNNWCWEAASLPVIQSKRELNLSLILIKNILKCYVGVSLKCLFITFNEFTESKQTKAWPELTKGFIVSSKS